MSQKPRCRKSVTVNLENGLHLVPSSQIARLAGTFPECEIRIHNGDLCVDAKDIFDLMTLNAEQGTILDLEAVGPGAQQAVDALVERFETNFADPGPASSAANGGDKGPSG